MAVFFLAAVIFAFLVAGAVTFLVCVAIPRSRRFALSAALWCASWGPCSCGLTMLGVATLAAGEFIAKAGIPHRFHPNASVHVFGWASLAVGIVASAAVATGAAWLHQFVVHRLTFALFRLYAAAVVAGIGSVFGWCFSWWMLLRGVAHAWTWSILGMVFLAGGFGIAAYKGAPSLRGEPPMNLAWVSREEYTG